jgi:hypothetical protein
VNTPRFSPSRARRQFGSQAAAGSAFITAVTTEGAAQIAHRATRATRSMPNSPVASARIAAPEGGMSIDVARRGALCRALAGIPTLQLPLFSQFDRNSRYWRRALRQSPAGRSGTSAASRTRRMFDNPASLRSQVEILTESFLDPAGVGHVAAHRPRIDPPAEPSPEALFLHFRSPVTIPAVSRKV